MTRAAAFAAVTFVFAAGSTAPRTSQTAAAPRLAAFEVTAKRFEFVPSRLEVTRGDHVRILIRSSDRDHGFAIRTLKVNRLVPAGGAPVVIEFDAVEAGTFDIVCSESCGPGHRNMRGTLVVVAREEP